MQVWPEPQQIQATRGNLTFAGALPVVVRGREPWLEKAAAQAARLVNDAAGRRPAKRRKQAGAPPLTILSNDALPPRLRSKRVARAEGYLLEVTPRRAILAAGDARGIFYGAQTLAQLVEREGSRSRIPAVTVRDWPRHPFRGAHLYLPAREELDFFERFLDFLAAFKFNTLFLEIGGGMEYEKHPEINRAWKKFCREAEAYTRDKDPRPDSMRPEGSKWYGRLHGGPSIGPDALQGSRAYSKNSTHTELAGGAWLTKDEIRRIVRECRKRHIEIVPEVQSLSHAYYLCVAHPEIAEREDDPWPDTYCPSNPKSYELLFDVMDEVIEAFKPRFVHIGHDEAYTFRICPRCRRRTGEDILAEDITRIHDHLAARGVRAIMWGDKLMYIIVGRRRGGGARRWQEYPGGRRWVQPPTHGAVGRIPEDVVIMDWYWGLQEDSERYFGKHGHEVIYGNFSPLGFKEWPRRSGAKNVRGGEISTWCGVTPWEFGHNGVFNNYYPGAQTLWNGAAVSRDDLMPHMAARMTRATEVLTQQRRTLVSGAARAVPLDLSSVAVPLPDALAGKMRTGAEMASVLGSGRFDMLAGAKGTLERAIVLDARRPQIRSLAVGRKVKSLLLLQGTTMDAYHAPTYAMYHRGPAQLIRCRVRYADGKTRTFNALYGEDIGGIEGMWPTKAGHCYRAVPVSVGKTHTLFAQEWVNPRPKVEVRSVDLSLGPDAAPRGEVIIPAISALV